MKIRGWLYVSESSAMFISDDMKESVSYLNWVDLRDEKLRKEFLKTFVLLRIDHRETYSSYHIEFEEVSMRQWFSSKVA